VDFCDLQGFFRAHRWKNGGDSFSEHGFPAAGRTDKNYFMISGHGDFEGSFGGMLTMNF